MPGLCRRPAAVAADTAPSCSQPPGRPAWLVSVLEKAMQNVLWIMDELTSSQVRVDGWGEQVGRPPRACWQPEGC